MSNPTDKEIHDKYLQLIQETNKTLLSCPFCGGKVTMFETEDGMGYDKELVVRILCMAQDCYAHRDVGLMSPRWSDKPYEEIMGYNCNRVTELSHRWNRRV